MPKTFEHEDWFPETRVLRYFVAVAEEGSITGAATRLRIAQPAVSRQIATLERDLGTELLVRKPRGIELTEAGEALLVHCHEIFALMSRTYREVAALGVIPNGVVVVGMPPTPGEIIIPPLVGLLRERYPEITVKFVEGFSRDLERALVRGDVTLAMMYATPDQGDFERRVLLNESLYLVGPPGSLTKAEYPFREAAAMPLIMPSYPNLLRITLDQAAKQQGVSPNYAQQVDGLSHLKALVRAGHGYTLLGYSGVRQDLANGMLDARIVVRPELTWQLCVASQPDQRDDPTVSIVEDAIAEIVAANIERGWG